MKQTHFKVSETLQLFLLYFNIRSSVQSHVNKSILISTLNEDTCPQLLGHSINLWEEFYRNLFRDRIEAIIGKKFQLFYVLVCVVLVKVNYMIIFFFWSQTYTPGAKFDNINLLWKMTKLTFLCFFTNKWFFYIKAKLMVSKS